MSNTTNPQDRVIRVFVSSTFRDMQAERDELVLRIFPQLRRLCEERGVTWGEIDLRWGITEEQSQRGEVLPICLEEIKRCRPYFIGLLGERYGWIPTAISDEVLEHEPWIKRHADGANKKSVTELEILHGVLNNPEMADHAFFYFRDPTFINRLPGDQKREDFITEDDQSFQKLNRLKDDIRRRSQDGELLYEPRENITDAKTLGAMVLADFTALIDTLYPPGQEPSPLERERRDHDAFARSRAGVYIGRQEYFDRLDAHIASDSLPLVVLGESGSGKSALLANWVMRYRERHPEDFLLSHFIGSLEASSNWAHMLTRFMAELKDAFGLEAEIPYKRDELSVAFANWLNMASSRCGQARPGSMASKGKTAWPSRIILVIDALNKLGDERGALDLVWIPSSLPGNVRLIVSTLPGRSLDVIKNRGWPSLAIEPFRADERARFIHAYLKQYTKQLGTERARRLADCPQAANPLFLRALLEELRVFGIHERLDERIQNYLQAESISELHKRILGRYEQDYDRDRSSLVCDTLSLIWASSRGLSEAELLDLLGTDGHPLPPAQWAPLYLAMEQSLVNRDGRMGFSHDYLRQAVQEAYLSDDNARLAAHLRLADYFDQREMGSRRIVELPWQLCEARAWDRLADLLCDPSFFAPAWYVDQHRVRKYWTCIEQNSELKLADLYSRALADPTNWDRQSRLYLAFLLEDVGELDDARLLFEEEERRCRETGDRYGLSVSLANQSAILYRRGNLHAALALLKEQERICRDVGAQHGLSACMGNQAMILEAHGQLDDALRYFEVQESLSCASGDRDGVQHALCGRARILKASGHLDAAMTLLKEQEHICQEQNNLDGLVDCWGEQALLLRATQQFDAALALHKREEGVCAETGNLHGLSVSYGNQAVIFQARGDVAQAIALIEKQKQLCEQLRDKEGLMKAVGNLAGILGRMGKILDAVRLHKREEALCRELDNPKGLSVSLANQAILAAKLWEARRACEIAREAHRIADEHGFVSIAERLKQMLQQLTVTAQSEADVAATQSHNAEGTTMNARQLFDEAKSHLEKKNFVMGWYEFRNATAVFLSEGNIDDASKSLMYYAHCSCRMDMKDDAKSAYVLACKLAESAQLSVLTCCQVWWGSGWGLGQHLEDFGEANVWMGKTKELAEFAGIDHRILPNHTKVTPAPNLDNDEVRNILREICELLKLK